MYNNDFQSPLFLEFNTKIEWGDLTSEQSKHLGDLKLYLHL